MSLGFEQAGFDVLLGIDLDGYHAAAHERNFPYGKTLCRSVAELTGTDIFAALDGESDIDVIFGGPPCQGFSNMGVRDAQDPRNTLVRQFARIVSEVRPKAFVMENVPGMLAGSTRPVLDDAIEFFERSGYVLAHPVRVLDASEFGVPQRRKRLILLGVRKDIGTAIDYPGAVRGDRPTVWEAIGDLPDVDARDDLFRANSTSYDREPVSEYARAMRGAADDRSDFSHPRAWDRTRCTGCLRVRHTDSAVALYAATSPGDMVPGHKLPRLDPDGIAPTLRAGSDSAHGSYTAPRPVHPTRPRCITAREAARLHGFPDWFSFYPLKWHAYRQIGNAVCPPVAKAIGAAVMRALGERPVKPHRIIELTDTFALPDERPRTLKRIPQIDNFPPVVRELFAAAFDPETKKLYRPRFGFEDVQAAIRKTKVNLSWTRGDTFLPEIARSRNVGRILEPCLSMGFTVRECDEGDAIGEFVRAGHPDGLDERNLLRVGSRELSGAVVLDGFDCSHLSTPHALFALLSRGEVVGALWGDGARVEVERRPGAATGTVAMPYRVTGPADRLGGGLVAAFEGRNVPNRSRLARLMSDTRSEELVVLLPVSKRHVLVARFDNAALPCELARRVFSCGEGTQKTKGRKRGEQQPSLF
jgi:DNA (cytosine-5)-methyltransferase 1